MSLIADQIKAYKDWISTGDGSASELITEGHSHVMRILESMRIESVRSQHLGERREKVLHALITNQAEQEAVLDELKGFFCQFVGAKTWDDLKKDFEEAKG